MLWADLAHTCHISKIFPQEIANFAMHTSPPRVDGNNKKLFIKNTTRRHVRDIDFVLQLPWVQRRRELPGGTAALPGHTIGKIPGLGLHHGDPAAQVLFGEFWAVMHFKNSCGAPD